MTNFYLVKDAQGEVQDCSTRKGAAIAVASHIKGSVLMLDVEISKETIRLLLAGHGGYSTRAELVYESTGD